MNNQCEQGCFVNGAFVCWEDCMCKMCHPEKHKVDLKMNNEYFEELVRAFGEQLDNYPEKKVIFNKTKYDGKNVVSMVIDGIDNEYDQFGDGKYPANWEIYLFEDGTWKIV